LPTIRQVQNAVAEIFGIKRDDLIGTSREAKYAHARAIAAMLCRREIVPPPSFPRIGREFGGRHHSTIVALEHRAHNLIDFKPEYFDKVRAVKQALISQP
jgi:chromosomal replication initiator protein